ncbi:hypothetical protein F2Q69_00054593 [Brassica cretica]|uniref:Uncharacterized protein n=1 Tax=Brassica cretica TaxID=69181 RepID=A0A8S9N8X2_BRACR|nr:hypothetical protein F2Q69_00054593 [Brassica cretica]
METISGGRNIGSSSGGTCSKEIRTNTGEGAHAWTVGLCNSCIVVMAGRWIMFDNRAWDFKIDNDRMGRAVDSSRIRGAEELKTCILAAYGLLGREVLVEMSYWLNDGESEMVGLVASSVEIATNKDFRIFNALASLSLPRQTLNMAIARVENPCMGTFGSNILILSSSPMLCAVRRPS